MQIRFERVSTPLSPHSASAGHRCRCGCGCDDGRLVPRTAPPRERRDIRIWLLRRGDAAHISQPDAHRPSAGERGCRCCALRRCATVVAPRGFQSEPSLLLPSRVSSVAVVLRSWTASVALLLRVPPVVRRVFHGGADQPSHTQPHCDGFTNTPHRRAPAPSVDLSKGVRRIDDSCRKGRCKCGRGSAARRHSRAPCTILARARMRLLLCGWLASAAAVPRCDLRRSGGGEQSGVSSDGDLAMNSQRVWIES